MRAIRSSRLASSRRARSARRPGDLGGGGLGFGQQVFVRPECARSAHDRFADADMAEGFGLHRSPQPEVAQGEDLALEPVLERGDLVELGVEVGGPVSWGARHAMDDSKELRRYRSHAGI